MIRYLVLVLVLLVGCAVEEQTVELSAIEKPEPVEQEQLRYIALGDSYTIGHGLLARESFPSQLVSEMRLSGQDIELIANPSVSGYTTKNLIDLELPVFRQSNANFVTMLIGANDVFQGKQQSEIQENFMFILDEILKTVDHENVIVLTIPNYAVTQMALDNVPNIGNEANRIREANAMIAEESEKRGILVVDLFELTSTLGKDESMFISDLLHPSAEQYSLWVDEILKHTEQ